MIGILPREVVDLETETHSIVESVEFPGSELIGAESTISIVKPFFVTAERFLPEGIVQRWHGQRGSDAHPSRSTDTWTRTRQRPIRSHVATTLPRDRAEIRLRIKERGFVNP